MCGIAGWINLKQSDSNHAAEPVLHSMCERILHRGPNSEGLWIDDTVALGMRRLSIIDLLTGRASNQAAGTIDKRNAQVGALNQVVDIAALAMGMPPGTVSKPKAGGTVNTSSVNKGSFTNPLAGLYQ